MGATNTKGTAARSDDLMATYSSRGPTYIDGLLKPDLVAPGQQDRVARRRPCRMLVRTHPELRLDATAGGTT